MGSSFRAGICLDHCRYWGQARTCVLVRGSPPDLARAAWTAADSAGEDGGVVDTAPGPGSLAGRDQELAALRGWRAEALAGGGRLVVLAGPPGIGKTRLAEELADGARRDGQRVLWGRAVEERGAPPLWPWRRILNAVGVAEQDRLAGDRVGDGARSDDLAAARFRAAAAAADAVTGAARDADLLVILEDLQWADHASLFLLGELAAELPGSRLLVLATCRDSAGDPWRASMAAMARLPGVHMLRLAPLSETAVAGLLRAAGVAADPELARFVHARSEGNALYVTTLARVLAAQPGAAADADAVARIAAGSAEVSHLVASLLRDLDDGASALLAAASVLGADFDSGLAAAVAGTSQDAARALSAAEACGLVARQPRWSHWPGTLRNGVVRSPRTCCGRHRTRPLSDGRPAGPRRQRPQRPPRSRSRTRSGTWPP